MRRRSVFHASSSKYCLREKGTQLFSAVRMCFLISPSFSFFAPSIRTECTWGSSRLAPVAQLVARTTATAQIIRRFSSTPTALAWAVVSRRHTPGPRRDKSAAPCTTTWRRVQPLGTLAANPLHPGRAAGYIGTWAGPAQHVLRWSRFMIDLVLAAVLAAGAAQLAAEPPTSTVAGIAPV